MGHRISQAATGEVVLEQSADVRDRRLVEVDVAPLFHEPLRAVGNPTKPTGETTGREGGRECVLQPVVAAVTIYEALS